MSLERLLAQHTEQDAENFTELREEFKAVRKDVSEIKLALEKQRGFIAGFSAAFSLLVSAIVALGAYIWNNMR